MKNKVKAQRPTKKHKPVSHQVQNTRRVSKLRRFVYSTVFHNKISPIISRSQANTEQPQLLQLNHRNKYLIAVVVRALAFAYRLSLDIYLYSLLLIHRMPMPDHELSNTEVQERAGAVFLLAARVFGQSRGLVMQNLVYHFEGVSMAAIEKAYRKALKKAQGIPILSIIREEEQPQLVYQIERLMIDRAERYCQEASWCSKEAEDTKDSHDSECIQKQPVGSKTM